jgi:hypothetical protein
MRWGNGLTTDQIYHVFLSVKKDSLLEEGRQRDRLHRPIQPTPAYGHLPIGPAEISAPAPLPSPHNDLSRHQSVRLLPAVSIT